MTFFLANCNSAHLLKEDCKAGVGNLWLSSQMWLFLMAAFVKKYVNNFKNMALSAKKWLSQQKRLPTPAVRDPLSQNLYDHSKICFFLSEHDFMDSVCREQKKVSVKDYID